jgi:hypothetical protein
MDISPVVLSAERVLAVPYKEAALDTDVLLKQVDGYLRSPEPSAAVRRQLKGLRDQLYAHRARSQMDLFSS